MMRVCRHGGVEVGSSGALETCCGPGDVEV